MMDIWLHTESVNGAATHLIDAVLPKFGSGSSYYGSGQLYGRYVIRFKSDAFNMYHASWLLWPNSGSWPGDGEIDFPEGDLNSNINAYMHWQNGTSGASQDAYSTNVPFGGNTWHTAVIEWLPSRCTFILDGTTIGNSTNTSRIPNTPMHLVIQNGGSFGQTPDNTSQGHIYIDWITIYKPA
jgi:beta-glucanase (GH16 family)